MRQAAKVGLRGAIPEAELRRIDQPVTLIWEARPPDPIADWREGDPGQAAKEQRRLSEVDLLGDEDPVDHVDDPVRRLDIGLDHGGAVDQDLFALHRDLKRSGD